MIGVMDVSEMARLGGEARAAKLTKKQRSESARLAVQARWEKHRSQKALAEAGTKKAGAKKKS